MRAVVDRELTQVGDWRLMCLERMRLLDLAHAWSKGTHRQYQGRLVFLRRFERRFGVRVLKATRLLRPPSGPGITLQWAQEHYSIRTEENSRTRQGERTLSFSAVRQLRSAVSQYQAVDLLVAHPEQTVVDERKRMTVQPCRLTDDASHTFFAQGLGSRIGDEARPSVALLQRHVHWIDADLDRRYQEASSPALRRELATAGLANVSLWLGWLRSQEMFGVTMDGVTVVEPANAAAEDLPEMCGAVIYGMGPETKTSRTTEASVIMAYQTCGGLRLGRWFHRVQRARGLGRDWQLSPQKLFTHEDGSAWDSRYFRETYLYPALRQQQAKGDPMLAAFDGGPGNTIPEKFWSLHCYRRGARTHVSKRRPGQLRKATKDQVYEHARWRRRRQGEDIDVIYREWTLRDRVMITLCSQ